MTSQLPRVGSNTAPIDAPSTISLGSGLPPDMSGLTAEGLLMYCQTQIGGLDAQIKGYFEKQQAANKTREAVNEVVRQLNDHLNGFLDGGDGDKKTCKDLDAAMQKAIDAAGGPKTAAGAALQSIADRMKATGSSDDSKMADFEVKKFVDDLKGVQSDINSSSELDMIQLQSLSQKRTTALSLCTNLVQSVAEPSKAIIANMRG